jgi:hypothetical protein
MSPTPVEQERRNAFDHSRIAYDIVLVVAIIGVTKKIKLILKY